MRFLHKELGLQARELQSFQVSCMVNAADLTMWAQPLQQLLILPGLLHQLCSLADSLRLLALAMKVCPVILLVQHVAAEQFGSQECG